VNGEPVVVGDRYELGESLGQGGMATVHRALDRRLDRAVAVKQLSVHLAADQTAQARFRREAQAAASLNHPNIAAVFDTGEGADSDRGVALPYIVMELVEGSTLRTLLDAGPLEPDRALRITRDVLDALEHSHAMGLVHRDIKPANVMLTTGGTVKVMDFGIARAIDESATSLTQTASVIGTAQYLSPEQAMGQKVDLRSDLYSVGCLLFELVTGRPPFVGETSVAIAYQHVRENPVPPSQLEPSLDPAFDAVVLHALAKDPGDRYQTAAQMRDDVDRLLAGEAVAPPPVPTDAAAGDTVRAAAPVLAVPVAAAAVSEGGGPQTAPTALLAAGLPSALPEDPAPDERRRSGATRAVLVALGVFLVLGLGAFGLFRVFGPAAGGSQVASVTVPDLDGLPQARAEAALRDADLVPRVTIESGKDDDTVGTVMDQTPAADARVAGGSTVTLAVNGGPDAAEIPEDLVGRPVADAEQALDDLGFSDVSTVAVSANGDVEPGEVISVEPDEGQRVALDAAIEIRFARQADAPATAEEDEDPEPSAPASPSETAEPDGDGDGDDAETTRPPENPSSEAPDDDEADEEPTTTAPTTKAPTRAPQPTAPTTSQASTEAPRKPKPTKTKKSPPGQGEGQGENQRQEQGGD
jgi:hypothetical protein